MMGSIQATQGIDGMPFLARLCIAAAIYGPIGFLLWVLLDDVIIWLLKIASQVVYLIAFVLI